MNDEQGTKRILLTHPHDGHSAWDTCLDCLAGPGETEGVSS